MARCRSSVSCRSTRAARVLAWPILAISSRRLAPAVAVSRLPVWRRSWKWIFGRSAAASAGSQTRRPKLLRRRCAPVGPVKSRIRKCQAIQELLMYWWESEPRVCVQARPARPGVLPGCSCPSGTLFGRPERRLSTGRIRQDGCASAICNGSSHPWILSGP
jgi:hypothetical protein